jgi:hypothetical protein
MNPKMSTPAGVRPETKNVGAKGPAARKGAEKKGYMPAGPNNIAWSKGATKS